MRALLLIALAGLMRAARSFAPLPGTFDELHMRNLLSNSMTAGVELELRAMQPLYRSIVWLTITTPEVW